MHDEFIEIWEKKHRETKASCNVDADVILISFLDDSNHCALTRETHRWAKFNQPTGTRKLKVRWGSGFALVRSPPPLLCPSAWDTHTSANAIRTKYRKTGNQQNSFKLEPPHWEVGTKLKFELSKGHRCQTWRISYTLNPFKILEEWVHRKLLFQQFWTLSQCKIVQK